MVTGNRPGQGALFATPSLRPYSQDGLDSTEFPGCYSLFNTAGEQLWAIDLGESDALFLTAFLPDSRIVIIRIHALGRVTVTQEYFEGF